MTSDVGILRSLAQFVDPDLSSGFTRGAAGLSDILTRGGQTLESLARRFEPIAARIEGPEAEQAFFARRQQEEELRQLQEEPQLRLQRAEALERAIGRPPQQLPAGVQGPPAPGRAPDIGALARLTGLGVPGAQKFGELAFKAQLGGDVDPTTLQRNLAAAGLRSGTPEFQQAVLRSITKPQVAITQAAQPGETAFQKERGKAASAKITQIQEQAGEAQALLGSTRIIQSALETGVQTGPLSGPVAFIGELANQLGIPVSEEFKQSGAEIRDIQRESNRIALGLTKKLKGALSNKELDFIVKTVTNIGTSPEANRRAIAALNAGAKLALEVEQLASGLLAEGRGRDISRELAAFRKRGRLQEIFEEELATLKFPETSGGIPGFTIPLGGQPSIDVNTLTQEQIDSEILEIKRRLGIGQ